MASRRRFPSSRGGQPLVERARRASSVRSVMPRRGCGRTAERARSAVALSGQGRSARPCDGPLRAARFRSRLGRARVGRAGELDRAEASAFGARDRAGRGIERELAPMLDLVGKQVLDRGEIDRCGGEDARTRGGAGDLGDREPFGTGKWVGWIEAETAPTNRLPALARGIAAARQAVGEGEGDDWAIAASLDCARDERGWIAIFGHAPRRFGSRRVAHPLQRRAASRSGSFPPSPRSLSNSAGLGGGLGEARARRFDQHVREARRRAAARRWHGRAA